MSEKGEERLRKEKTMIKIAKSKAGTLALKRKSKIISKILADNYKIKPLK
jgi:hypothetical protein